MTTNPKLKEVYEPETKHGAFYTGGNVEWHQNYLYCQTVSSVQILDVETGTVVRSVGEEDSDDADSMQTFTSDGHRIVSSHKSGLLKLWNENGEQVKVWKYIHKGPIASLQLKGDLLASGGSDSTVRLWNLQYQACTLSLRGAQGVVSLLEFVPFDDDSLFGSGDDGKLMCWCTKKGDVKTTYSAHFSKITCLKFHHDDRHFVTCGRDKVVILWRYQNAVSLRMIPLNEATESIIVLPKTFKLSNFKPEEDGIYVGTAGEGGIVHVWDVTKSKEVFVQNNSLISKATDEGGLAIMKIMLDDTKKLICLVTSDQNILLYILKSFQCYKQFVGFSDEILDVTFVGKSDVCLAVATNSPDIKLYENSTMNCQLLKGHTDLVLSLTTSKSNPNFMISGSKDNTIRLWKLLEETKTMTCVGLGVSHTGSVGSVCFSQTNENFLVSVSQDTCIKLWDIPKKLKAQQNLICTKTEIAHQKDINCVVVSPNDRIIATGSQDKTAKLWTETAGPIGTLRGHKRGVWSVCFSPVDQIVITSSVDCTIKLWSVAQLNCLKTLEGHESSVLQVTFISNGLQILSTGADGLVKIFSVKTSECTATFDEHSGRIWALCVNEDESQLVTGGSDSLLIKWKDVTTEKHQERIKQLEQLALEEQQLSNYVKNNELLKALKLALKLDKPLQVLRIVNNVIKKGDTGLNDAITNLTDEQKETLLKCASNWNTNSKNSQSAQLVLNILMKDLQTGKFQPRGLGTTLEGTIPYTQRHFKRLTQLMQDLHILKYTVNCMQPYNKPNDNRKT